MTLTELILSLHLLAFENQLNQTRLLLRKASMPSEKYKIITNFFPQFLKTKHRYYSTLQEKRYEEHINFFFENIGARKNPSTNFWELEFEGNKFEFRFYWATGKYRNKVILVLMNGRRITMRDFKKMLITYLLKI